MADLFLTALTLLLIAADAGTDAAAPSSVVLAKARYEHELGGAKVGFVELTLEPGQFAYRSHPFFGADEEIDQLPIAAGEPTPEALWLWHPPETGCVEGIDEVSRRRGQLCATDRTPSQVTGTLLEKPFVAKYRDGELAELVVGDSRFVRDRSALPLKNPFRDGFAIAGRSRGPLHLHPSLAGAAPPPNAPTPMATKLDRGQCLNAARAFIAAHPGATLVLGLVRDNGRAYPHAWAQTADGTHVDPSALGARTLAQDYLVLPPALAAQAYLELLSGRRAVR